MKKIDLTKGNVMKVLLALALPIMGSSLLQFTYNLVDMLWVGRLGSDAVASIGSSSFFISLGYAINALIMVGTGIKVSHCMGKADHVAMKEYIHTGVLLTAFTGLIYMSILIIFGKGLIGFLNLKDQKIVREAYLYLAFSGPMIFFAFFNNLLTRIFASLGNSKTAFKVNTVGVIANVILDPLFIYGMKWGVVGAAIATLVANILMFLLYLRKSKGEIDFRFNKKIDLSKIKEITILGSPIAFQRILFTLINILLAKMIATFGADAVAAQKIGLQIESITYMVTGGLNGAVASFVGQNYGARKYDRMRKGYLTALAIGSIYAALSAVIFLVFPEQLTSWFVDKGMTIAIASSYLKIIAYSQIFNAMEMVTNGFLTGIGKPKIPAIVSILFTALRLPIAYICVRYLGLEGIWWSITLSTILKGSVLVGIYQFKIKRELLNEFV